jgi:hypothetical protein
MEARGTSRIQDQVTYLKKNELDANCPHISVFLLYITETLISISQKRDSANDVLILHRYGAKERGNRTRELDSKNYNGW